MMKSVKFIDRANPLSDCWGGIENRRDQTSALGEGALPKRQSDHATISAQLFRAMAQTDYREWLFVIMEEF